jgi:glycosyltransferase involved in cell wall biosynthesis
MRVDVVIPSYNYARFLEDCVGSVLSQEGVEARALIIDDCSGDDTFEVGTNLTRRDSRVLLRRHSQNRGHIATYNEGLLEWAEAEYALLLSADDVLAPGALRRATDVMDACRNVGMCYGLQTTFSWDVPTADGRVAEYARHEVVKGEEFLEIACRGGSNPVATPTALVRTDLQRRIGGYRKTLPHTGDLEMWLRFAAHASIGRIDAVQAYKREHANNMVKQFTDTIVPDLQQRMLAFESALCGCRELVRDPAGLLRLARDSLAEEAFWSANRAFENGRGELVQELLEMAAEWDSTWRSRPAWQRFQWKRRAGSRAWRMVEPVVTFLRHG